MTREVDGQLTTQKKPALSAPRWRRAMVASSVVLAMLITGVGLLPAIVIHSSLRDRVLSSGIGDETWTATSGKASGGWLAPLVFHEVRITDPDGRFLCTIRELRTSKGLLGFLMDRADVGLVSLIQPRVEVHVTEDGKWPECSPHPSNTRFRYVIEDASLIVTVPWREVPIIDLAQLDVTGKIGPNAEGLRMLTVDATQILDHEQLSEAHTEQNLALIAPVLSQSTQVNGSASVWLDETHILMDQTKKTPFPVKGRAEFHSLEARLKPEWIRQLAAVTGQLTGTNLPDRMEVLKDSRVEFEVTDEGVIHDSMVFLLPEIAEELSISSSGIIRLDESLDLRLVVTIPKFIAADKPLLSVLAQLTSEPLQLAVRGTVSKPQLQLPEGTDLLGTITGRVTPAGNSEIAPPLTSAILNVVQDASNPDKDQTREALPGSILNLIRAIDQKAKENAEQKPKRARKKK